MTRYFGVHTLEGEWHSLLPRYVLIADRVANKQILDIGCGTGIGSSLLLEMGAKNVNAIDHRPEVLELARVKHAKQGLNFNVMFWEELDFPDDTFDMVLCLDPTSPVTDPSLLLEVKRVLRPGGEYICAIERRNIDGLESLLPRYGYGSRGEELNLNRSGERVPQIGNLDEFFPSILSVVQRPRYSFVFDHADDDEQHTRRRRTGEPDESGIWVGDEANLEEGSAEQTDERPGRWIDVDGRLCDRDGEPAAVEVFYCGDEHMPPPALREVHMPYRGLVDRLHQLFSDLQLRQHPDQEPSSPSTRDEPTNQFRERTETNEFHAYPEPESLDRASTPVHDTEAQGGGNWNEVRKQLDHMTHLYEQVRTEMQDLFFRTRQELAQRDRYIEQLVETIHRWRHDSTPGPPESPVAAPTTAESPDAGAEKTTGDFDREPTSIFTRRPLEDEEALDSEEQSLTEERIEPDQSAAAEAQAPSAGAEDNLGESGDSAAGEEPQDEVAEDEKLSGDETSTPEETAELADADSASTKADSSPSSDASSTGDDDGKNTDDDDDADEESTGGEDSEEGEQPDPAEATSESDADDEDADDEDADDENSLPSPANTTEQT